MAFQESPARLGQPGLTPVLLASELPLLGSQAEPLVLEVFNKQTCHGCACAPPADTHPTSSQSLESDLLLMCSCLLGSEMERLSHLPPAPGSQEAARAQGVRACAPPSQGWLPLQQGRGVDGRAWTPGTHHHPTTCWAQQAWCLPVSVKHELSAHSANSRGQPSFRQKWVGPWPVPGTRTYQESSKWVE